jgi:hypothetical protein
MRQASEHALAASAVADVHAHHAETLFMQTGM